MFTTSLIKFFRKINTDLRIKVTLLVSKESTDYGCTTYGPKVYRGFQDQLVKPLRCKYESTYGRYVLVDVIRYDALDPFLFLHPGNKLLITLGTLSLSRNLVRVPGDTYFRDSKSYGSSE